MKTQKGFTLIELVIVIVILGILGAVAAPKFLNLQGDAYGANLNSLKNSVESAATMTNTKAILAGQDGVSGSISSIRGVSGAVALVYGYPKADTSTGITKLLDINDNDYDIAASGSTTVIFKPEARKSETNCSVAYTNAAKDERPVIVVNTSDC